MWNRIFFSLQIRCCLWIDQLVSIPKKARSPKTLLVVRTDAIGDYLLFRNFLRVLKCSERFKGYEITLCGNQVWADLVKHYDQHLLSSFIPIDRKKFFKNPIYRYQIQSKIHQKGFEIAINPVFSDELLYGHSIIRASCATSRISSVGDLYNIITKDKQIADSFYTHQLSASNEILFEFNRNKEFFEKLLDQKIGIQKPKLEHREDFTFDLEPQKYVVLFSGASLHDRCWSSSNFRYIAKKIHDHWHLKIVLAGSSSDAVYGHKIEENNTISFINLIGKTTLTQLVSLIRNAFFLVTNETSAIHFGASTQTPSFCISKTAWHYGRFMPYPKNMNLPISCIFPPKINGLDPTTIHHKFPEPDMMDINSIQKEDVWEKMQEVYKNLSNQY